MMSISIREEINSWDEYCTTQQHEKDEETKDSPYQFNNIYLGARQPSITIASLLVLKAQDEAFHNFQRKLKYCIQTILGQESNSSTTEIDIKAIAQVR